MKSTAVAEPNQTPEVDRPAWSRRSSSVVLVTRLLLVVVAAGAVVVAVASGRRHDRSAGDSVARFICPMHAEVTSSGPGTCPICGMELEPERSSGSALNPSTFQAYEFVRRRGFGQDLRVPAWVEPDGTVVALVY